MNEPLTTIKIGARLLVVPLAAIGICCLVILAFAKLLEGDPWYLVTFVAIGGLGAAAIYNLAKTYRAAQGRAEEDERQ